MRMKTNLTRYLATSHLHGSISVLRRPSVRCHHHAVDFRKRRDRREQQSGCGHRHRDGRFDRHEYLSHA